ncbi:MAG: flagellar type III secretion system protein FlhB [Paracoccus sp. (in: a-proteobacteria)]|uniref:EscU/YscU/HrcU family type III secretion system export apparatus switch protein n=1 Tax=Paracoccus sp. TaxID=267 RepID=UPI0026DEBC6C|nr:flagellar type III secretion system protein FlhB [Paracoccus sp. (in: a-proteobacteria)]MDO5621675.1 flagellar type III secretion system protein FlhB [Paracoccus sp. (in: a-proteobacteria)]
MAEDEDKQFEPTEQRLRKAREDGDIPRSTEVNAALAYIGLAIALMVVMPFFLRAWLPMAGRAMGDEGWPEIGAFDLARALAGFAGVAVLALVAIPALIILAGITAQRGFAVSTKKLKPDMKKLNPFSNAKKKFGPSGLVTFAISAGKAIAVGVGGWFLFRSLLILLSETGFMGERQWLSATGLILMRVLALAITISVAFAVIDLFWKRREHLKKLRMSRKEMQDEHKDSEGDPHLKQQRRQKAVEIATSSMLADVAKADVIVVNPTHYAVALEWKRGSGRAPVCVAKGVDQVAARIREKAGEHQVPIWSDPPCARALYATVDIGHEIHPEHFAAVAAAIRFAEAMREKARKGW